MRMQLRGVGGDLGQPGVWWAGRAGAGGGGLDLSLVIASIFLNLFLLQH